MKEINGQLYGYSYELDQTTEEDLTTCYAIDTGTIFVAFNGIWCEQRDAKWAAGASGSGGGGGGSDVLVRIGVTVDEQTEAFTLQKTGQEILDYVSAGLIPYIDFSFGDSPQVHQVGVFTSYSKEPTSLYEANHTFSFGRPSFVCDNLSGYPVAD